MKKIIAILAILMTLFTLSSCVTAAQAQVDAVYDVYDDDVDVNVVITYGTPYYDTSGLLLYYVYRDMFYYPYIYNNLYYFHRYSRPLPYDRYHRLYKPLPRDFHKHHSYGMRHVHRGWNGHHNGRVMPPSRGHHNPRPNIHNHKHSPRVDVKPNTPSRRFESGRPNHSIRPNGGTRPNINRGTMRPNINRGGGSMRPQMPRSSTRITANGHGHHSGRR